MGTPSLQTSNQSIGRTLAVLAYHKVGEPAPGGWETWYYIPEATFIAQLSYLRDNDWQVIDLATFLHSLTAPESLPERAALITFDDGYRSNRTVALPLLRQFGYPAVIFVPTGFIGGRNTFDTDVEPDEAICDWDDLRELERCGVAVQSHGVSHRTFSELAPAEQEEEARQSKAVLEAGLGRSVEVFSYPYNDSGTNPREVAELMRRTGYRAAFLYTGGVNHLPATNLYRMTRVAMGPDTNLSKRLRR